MAVNYDALLWHDEDCNLQDVYLETPEGIQHLPHYLSRFHDTREREIMPTFRELMRSGRLTDNPTDIPGFYDSNLHQEVFLPMAIRHLVHLALRQQGRPVASLLRGRVGRGAFGGRDTERLTELAPLLTHLLVAWGEPLAEPVQGGEDRREILIADADGKVQYALSNGLYFFYRAAGLVIRSGAITDPAHQGVRPLLRELARRVGQLAR